jgi:tRNA (guanine37-N1)-methyltransferase
VYANDLNPSSAKYLAANIHLNKVAGRVVPFNMDGRQFVRLLLDTPGGPAQQARQQAADAAAAAAAAADTGGGVVAAQGAGAGPASTAGAQQPPQQQQQQQKRSSSKQLKRPPLEVPPPWPAGFAPPSGGLHFQHAIMNLPASAVEFLDAFYGAFDPVSWQGRQLPWVHCYTFMKNETEEGECPGAGGAYSAGAVGIWVGHGPSSRSVGSCVLCGGAACSHVAGSSWCMVGDIFALPITASGTYVSLYRHQSNH